MSVNWLSTLTIGGLLALAGWELSSLPESGCLCHAIGHALTAAALSLFHVGRSHEEKPLPDEGHRPDAVSYSDDDIPF